MFTIEQINELKKALHCCGNALGCEECPYNKVTCCQDRLNKDALTLILEYEDTIQQLETEVDKQYEQAEANILGNMSDGGTSCHWCIAQHKSKAIKEFADKILNYLYTCIEECDNMTAEDPVWVNRLRWSKECIVIHINECLSEFEKT